MSTKNKTKKMIQCKNRMIANIMEIYLYNILKISQ